MPLCAGTKPEHDAGVTLVGKIETPTMLARKTADVEQTHDAVDFDGNFHSFLRHRSLIFSFGHHCDGYNVRPNNNSTIQME